MDLTTFVVIVIIFLVLLGWYLFQNNVFRRTRSVAALKSEEISEQNIFAIDYHREIERAIQAANYRLAIRFMFLRLLADLSREGIIHYKQEKTNFDYLSQLNATVYYNDFFRLTRNYEFAWYGKFDISPETFTIIKNEFENFEHQWQ